MELYTIKQLAEKYKGTALSEFRIRKAVVSGELPSKRFGAKYVVLWSDFVKWVTGEDDNGETA
jgi:hypothetical protein